MFNLVVCKLPLGFERLKFAMKVTLQAILHRGYCLQIKHENCLSSLTPAVKASDTFLEHQGFESRPGDNITESDQRASSASPEKFRGTNLKQTAAAPLPYPFPHYHSTLYNVKPTTVTTNITVARIGELQYRPPLGMITCQLRPPLIQKLISQRHPLMSHIFFGWTSSVKPQIKILYAYFVSSK
jgi:hypothetical protein